MNKVEAIKATRNGAIAAGILPAISLILVLIAIYTNAEQKLAPLNEPWMLLNLIIILIFAFGIYRKSRVASILLFLDEIVFIIKAIYTQSFIGFFIIAFVFLYFFAKAIQGSFVYHKLEKEENPAYKATTKWTYIIGIPLVLIYFVTTGYELMSTIGVIPSQKVQHGTEIRTTDINTLIDNDIITTF